MMDKFNVFLAQAKKHYFWVLFGFAIITTFACWFLATGSLADEYSKRAGTLKSAFDATKRICEVIDHPNPEVVKAHVVTTEKVGKDAYDAWQALYTEQKNKNRLPESLKKKIGSAEYEQFKKEFESAGKLSSSLREAYQAFIGNHLPTLWTTIKCREPVPQKTPGDAETQPKRVGGPGAIRITPRPGAGGAAGGNAAGGGAAGGNAAPVKEELVGIVDWDKTERDRIADRFKWPNITPSDLQVRLAQEDLWVYEALLRVIEKVNESATAHHNAPIKRILNLDIGQTAADAFSKTRGTIVAEGADAAGGSQTNKPLATGPGQGTPTQAPGQGTVAVTDEEERLLTKRYVDAEGKPLAANAQRGEFKMMPVLMRLVIQQKMIPKLLVECANSSMPIEVRMIRLRPGEGQSGGAKSNPSTPNPAAPGGGGPGNRPRGGSGDGPNNFGDTDITGLDVPVEIQGVIYIFNPPDKARFGLDKAGVSGQPVDAAGTAPTGATPTGTTPTGTTPADSTTPVDGDAKDPKATPVEKPTQEPADESKTPVETPDKKTDKEASPAEGDAAAGEGGA